MAQGIGKNSLKLLAENQLSIADRGTPNEEIVSPRVIMTLVQRGAILSGTLANSCLIPIMDKHQRISINTMMHLQIAKWGNSLAVRIPADYVRQIGVKEGDQLSASLGVDGALNLRPSKWNRKAFAEELARDSQALPMGESVIEKLRKQARY